MAAPLPCRHELREGILGAFLKVHEEAGGLVMVWEWVMGAALGFGLHGRENTKPRQHDVISASAQIEFPLDDGSTHVQEISSPGQLWDGTPEDLKRIEAEERSKLAEMLEAMGIDARP